MASIQLFPHLLSYYSFGVGGMRGAANLDLETTYWCESYLPAVEYINEHADPGDKVWVEAWSHDVLVYYMLHQTQHYTQWKPITMEWINRNKPVYEIIIEDQPIMMVYDLR
ncbi:MAG: hypothetical protein ISR58_06820 [Anaerolineales bacterium]|nr:hypothetical protein [Chloroflexota bacterium]MBL6980887.1 hypothetical protein [Anaerolineales bacterium]